MSAGWVTCWLGRRIAVVLLLAGLGLALSTVTAAPAGTARAGAAQDTPTLRVALTTGIDTLNPRHDSTRMLLSASRRQSPGWRAPDPA
jgi:hypothetical protein